MCLTSRRDPWQVSFQVGGVQVQILSWGGGGVLKYYKFDILAINHDKSGNYNRS